MHTFYLSNPLCGGALHVAGGDRPVHDNIPLHRGQGGNASYKIWVKQHLQAIQDSFQDFYVVFSSVCPKNYKLGERIQQSNWIYLRKNETLDLEKQERSGKQMR